ncbi:MAG: hypothetical protein BRD55_08325 [Bacteroidetes bacterium SW_9_63_38]|nr:MAG: hypothetical protein BRD55_08325 [Bacteroidetes bacterium SW_9_63_38]
MMRNGAYTLATMAALGGLVLLSVAGQGDYRTALGVMLFLAAGVLAGIGRGVDVLGYVHEGVRRSDEHEQR